jgi:hypothetical protein
MTSEWVCTIRGTPIAFAVETELPGPLRLLFQHLETPAAVPRGADGNQDWSDRGEGARRGWTSFEAAIKGAFYAEEMRAMLAEGRIRPIEIEKEVRVHTAWDLGVSDSTAIWFIQCVGRERRLVDYYEGSGVGLDHYAQVLHDKRVKYGWKYGDLCPASALVRQNWHYMLVYDQMPLSAPGEPAKVGRYRLEEIIYSSKQSVKAA